MWVDPSSVTFPKIYTLAAAKGGFVADFWDYSAEVRGWNPRFLQSFNDWELEQVFNLFASIQVFNLSKEGNFTVKSLYDNLMGGRV